MRKIYRVQVGGVLLTLLGLCLLLATPVQAATRTNARHAASTSSINANVYLTGQMLRPLFQSNLNQQVPQVVGNAISAMVGQLPKQDQSWASQIANALLQPSAALVSLVPVKGGLLTTISVSLYPGDPKATTTSFLIGFSVANPSTIQVTALPPPGGGQSLVSGPLTTFQVPIGSLNSVAATPACGDANLNINLTFPLALGQSGQAASQGSVTAMPLSYTRPLVLTSTSAPTSYLEIPTSSLARLGGSIGSMSLGNNLTADNVRVGTAGHNLTVTSDIHWFGLIIGTAVSTMVPAASNGNLVVHVSNTDLQILAGLISFPVNTYNRQVEQMLNTKLNGALQGKFTVTQAAIGSNAHLPCAASTSLVLGGTIALG